MTRYLTVWAFEDAPSDLKTLSDNGGDEDWLILIPAALVERIFQYGTPFWMRATDSCQEPQRHDLSDGSAVVIGSHA